MAKFILTSRYIKNPAFANAGKLLQYMATRDGVEKLPKGIDNKPATKQQEKLIKSIAKNFPETKKSIEFEDYENEPTKANASEFLSYFEENYADKAENMKGLVRYFAERPGVEKLGSHGLFSQTDDKINLNEVADEVNNHDGVVWTHVLSLRREDAERLGYNKADAWKKLVRRNVAAIAEAHKIDLDDLQWYAAFHNTGHHPHIHLMVYSKSGQGYLTNKGIEKLRSRFGNDIFRNEQYKLFEMQTEIRNEIKQESKSVIDELLANVSENHTPSDELVDLFRQLSAAMKEHKGKWLYGYLPKPTKDLVDKIIHEIAKDEGIAALYSKWNEINREKLSLYHEKETPDIPLEDNKEFRSIKNDLLRAFKILSQLPPENPVNAAQVKASASGILLQLAKLIAQSCQRKRAKLRSQVDSKLLSAIEEKKRAHGLKTDKSAQSNDDSEEEYYGISM
ncbi:MobP3 family relaxase [Ruminococcus difficilis]|uniref:Serine/threonine protein phosphatase n=1 Tax=Ruminococcus difficilis TaxID=2763069 RepID=A0A934WR47_9FIRM|nr:MobP3 family relaxase [Ruminococcus difficilis]MBK6087904.1 hypothetical protein [Ruminococcus difficilis]